MDAVFLLLTAALAASTLGLVWLCDSLLGAKP